MKKPAPRQCLPCTACCQGWLRAEIHGHEVCAGKPCPFSKPEGCGIYTTRPQDPCRNFVCSWLIADSPLPDWMRPDQCGAIVLLSMPWHGRRVINATPVGQSIPERTLEWLKQYAQRHNRPLIFYEREVGQNGYSGLKQIGYGPPDFKRLATRVAAEESALAMVSGDDQEKPS